MKKYALMLLVVLAFHTVGWGSVIGLVSPGSSLIPNSRLHLRPSAQMYSTLPSCHFVSGPELVCRYASGPKCWYESVSRSSFAAGPERERGRFPDQPRQRACEWRGPERHVRVGYFELFEQQLAIPITDGAAAGAVAMAVLA